MNLKNFFSIVFFFGFISTGVFAQQNDGKVEVIEDVRISLLQQKRLEFLVGGDYKEEAKRPGSKGTVLGFRVQIFTGSSRSEAYAAQSRFMRMYKDIPTYVGYVQPNYRVKVGDFRSRSDAQAIMRELKKNFGSVFLFTEQINVVY